MRDRWLRGFLAGLVATVMVGTAVVSAWLLLTSGVLAGSAPTLRSPEPGVSPAVQAAEADASVRITGSFQVSQPRDPFRPLITEDSPLAVIPGVGGVPGTGTTPDNGDFTPGETSITLVEIRDVDGTLRATIVVNGVSYDVGEGETFAGSYKVVELTEDSAVIMFGDTAFELQVGQQIMK